MGILRFEWMQYKKSIFVWSITLGGGILFLFPIFAGMLQGDVSGTVSALENNPMMAALGISPENFFSPMGMFALLNNFLILAASIQAINLGLSIITKEHMQNTADFLITKPYSRSQVFCYKMLAALYGVLTIAGAYLVGSVVAVFMTTNGQFPVGQFILLYLMFPLVQILFLCFGIFIGIIISRVGTTLPIALGVSFGLFVVGLFSSVVSSDIARKFSPFRYFNSDYIMTNLQFESGYMFLYVSLVLLATLIGYRIYMTKDMKMVL